MLTNNFYNVFKVCMEGTTLINGAQTRDGSTKNIYPSSYGYASLLSGFRNSSRYVVGSTYGTGWAFGTGSTPPTLNDYNLSGDLITTVSVVANTVNGSITDGKYRFIIAATVSNSGTDTIVINELGIVASVYHDSSGSVPCLLDRTVLDTPLTLAPGEQGVITYTFNLPIVQ